MVILSINFSVQSDHFVCVAESDHTYILGLLHTTNFYLVAVKHKCLPLIFYLYYPCMWPISNTKLLRKTGFTSNSVKIKGGGGIPTSPPSSPGQDTSGCCSYCFPKIAHIFEFSRSRTALKAVNSSVQNTA